MLCKRCGRENENNATFCVYCMTDQKEYFDESFSACVTEEDENRGFSKADTEYEPSQVLVTKNVENNKSRNDSKIESNVISNSTVKSSANKQQRKEERVRSKDEARASRMTKRKLRKQAQQRQLSLQQVLHERLKEENHEALSQYMYQGLNQDITEEEENQSLKKDKTFRRSVLGIVTGILLTLCIVLYIGSMSEKTDYILKAKDAIEIYSDKNENKTYVFNAQGDMLFKANGYYQPYYTPDHSAAILYNRYLQTGIYVNNNRLKTFDSTVEAFALSNDGNFILYSIPGGLGKYYLKLYDVTKNTDVMIDNQAKRFELLNVLPGGKVISYLTYIESADTNPQEIQSFLVRNNGTPELVGDNICVFAVSYDMNNIYYYTLKDADLDTLHVRINGKDILLSKNVSNTLYFNKDYSQVLVADGRNYYISGQGSERQKIIDHMLTGILIPRKGIMYSNSALYRYYGIESFNHKLLRSSDNSIQLFREKQPVKEMAITGDDESAMLSVDGSSLLYLDSTNTLILLTDIYGEAKQSILAENVAEYKASDDLSKIFYIYNHNLYYIEPGKKEQLISKEVRDLCRNYEGDSVFYLKNYHNGEGTLYYSKNGGSEELVEDGTRVAGVREWNFGVIYQKYVNGSIAVFYNTKGTNFRFIMDGINLLGTNFY